MMMMMMLIFVGLQFSPFGCRSLNGITCAIHNYVLLCISVFCEGMAFTCNSFFITFLIVDQIFLRKKKKMVNWHGYALFGAQTSHIMHIIV